MNILHTKISELCLLAQVEQDNNSAIVLNALSGSIDCGLDGMLAVCVQDFVRTILLPKLKEMKASQIASNN